MSSKQTNNSPGLSPIEGQFSGPYGQIGPEVNSRDVIKPNLVGDSYVRQLNSLHFPLVTGYHRFNYPIYRPVEYSFIESIAIRLVTKAG
jgi:hypothetical protein